MGRPFNAIEPGDTLNTCMKKLSSVPAHVECNSVSEICKKMKNLGVLVLITTNTAGNRILNIRIDKQ
jgi:hypothetical protein